MCASPAAAPMSAAPRLRMTSDEFLEWEARQENKHEYYRGEVFPMVERSAMAGGTETHASIIDNVHFLLSQTARPRGCKVYNEAMRVRVDAADINTYPDLSVVCGEARFADARRTALLNPLVLVEVLSPSTEAYDRTTKWNFYAQIPELAAYVLVSQDGPAVDVYTRDGDGWRVVHTESGEALLPALDAVLPLAEIYDGVTFPGPEARLRPTPGV